MPTEPVPGQPDDDPRHERRLRALYADLAARDVPRALAVMSPDVDWPDAWTGGRLRGRGEVGELLRAGRGGPRFEPYAVTALDDGRVAVDLRYRVRDHDGTVLMDGTLRHVHRFDDRGRVARMDVDEPPPD